MHDTPTRPPEDQRSESTSSSDREVGRAWRRPPQPGGEERRAEPRLDARFRVTFGTDREFLAEYTRNLSRDGLFIRTDAALTPGARIQVALVLPNLGDPLVLDAVVVHRQAPEQGRAAGVGVRLSGSQPDRRRYLRELAALMKRREERREGHVATRRRSAWREGWSGPSSGWTP